jgi:hypothetical protein
VLELGFHGVAGDEEVFGFFVIALGLSFEVGVVLGVPSVRKAI